MIKIKYNKTPRQIEAETGRKFIDIYNDLKAEGFSDTEIAHKLELKRVSDMTTFLHIEKTRLNTNPIYIELSGLKLQELEKQFPLVVGIQYSEFLFEKYIQERLSAYEIAALLGLNYRTVARHIKRYGYTKDLSTARHDAIKKGLIDYDKILKKSANSRKKSESRSNVQELIREILKQHLVETLYKQKLDNDIEIIVGYNEWSILMGKEVDIPIVFCDVKTQRFQKYAVEVNGEYWHNAEKDDQKQQLLEQRGWKHYIIKADSTSNFYMEQEAMRVSNEIVTDFIKEQD